ncbi:ferritin-like domain-containing protein [Telmatospirillum sp.]|uniref:ferritin-like domain-containing protein n=1 Tax=Telmatospirillum sp. TaxID=2079197 RepID=UPI00284350A6|nr:ferritin-like domain-containing protein [Telmatospirillum sp.]MDR3439019.1 ferritin-like domain-containing protein [Telmatospirillum sp.]
MRDSSLTDAALAVLSAGLPADKVRLTDMAAMAWQRGEMTGIGHARPPGRPARPDEPPTLPPRQMPKRRLGGENGKIAMLHALAHIELNAIDLAWDIIVRFTHLAPPKDFFDDWVTVAREEARHFAALDTLLHQLGSRYGALPAHDGLWEAAEKTADDILSRLAVVPMTLEARALDTAPATIARLRNDGEDAIVAVLDSILEDEIGHVATGVRWFTRLCLETGTDPVQRYQVTISQHFTKGLKAPFNRAARDRAGLRPAFYEPLAGPF